MTDDPTWTTSTPFTYGFVTGAELLLRKRDMVAHGMAESEAREILGLGERYEGSD